MGSRSQVLPIGLQIRGLKKAYGNTQALDGLDLTVDAGQLTGIAGPNGAGKSTLVRVLAGETNADAGSILVDGALWSPGSAGHRVAVVHQEPQLFPNLTVGDNLIVGREESLFRRPTPGDREHALLAEMALAEQADRPLRSCSLAVQQRTEIARALAQDARLFLFDEPNSALTEDESDDLFRYLHALADRGHIVVLVSHRLSELVAHCKRVIIVLDGRVDSSLEGDALNQEAIAQRLVAGQVKATAGLPRPGAAVAESGPVLRLRRWTHAEKAFHDVDLTVDRGEIVALIGVEGSGARELLRSIAKFEPVATGGKDETRTGLDLVQETEYVSADRRASLFGNLSVGENIVARLGTPHIAGAAGVLRRRRIAELATGFVRQFRIRCRSVYQLVLSLSGGNQQKVAIAAAIIREPSLLVLEEPTRGVDIHSKAEIHRLLREFAAHGRAVVMLCTEVPEVFEAADRLYVVSDGTVSAPLMTARYADVGALATDISRLERHHVGASAADNQSSA